VTFIGSGYITDAEVVTACRDTMGHREGNPVIYLRERRPEQTTRSIVAALRRAHDKGLINYGVTIEQAWPTPKGFALLRPKGI